MPPDTASTTRDDLCQTVYTYTETDRTDSAVTTAAALHALAWSYALVSVGETYVLTIKPYGVRAESAQRPQIDAKSGPGRARSPRCAETVSTAPVSCLP